MTSYAARTHSERLIGGPGRHELHQTPSSLCSRKKTDSSPCSGVGTCDARGYLTATYFYKFKLTCPCNCTGCRLVLLICLIRVVYLGSVGAAIIWNKLQKVNVPLIVCNDQFGFG
ncbi:hypothetical protein ZWY2020_058142 [Hordeum vulgare]|nr:hypothetical protein ZWY2020_058142 [Hordeum vulgare]